ncbi:MAG: hypothetical protein M1831_000547 [Alyxoria varia]|nr:MAG: hypothetical protein M1831_000547 [Alyxoria varia]
MAGAVGSTSNDNPRSQPQDNSPSTHSPTGETASLELSDSDSVVRRLSTGLDSPQYTDPSHRFATALYESCLAGLVALRVLLKAWCKPQQAASLKSSLESLYLLGVGVAGHKLDFCLDHEPELQRVVLSTFLELARSFVRAFDVFGNDAGVIKEVASSRMELLIILECGEIWESRDFQESDTESSTDPSDNEDSNLPKQQQVASRIPKLVRSIKERIENLLDLTPTIEMAYNTFVRTMKRDAATVARPSSKKATPSNAYVTQIRDRYPSAEVEVVNRLGEANWQRHTRLRKQQETGLHTTAANEDQSETIHPESMASKFKDSGIGSSANSASLPQISAASQTSSIPDESVPDGAHRVPPTPKAVFQGTPFKCFLCLRNLTNIRNRTDWK